LSVGGLANRSLSISLADLRALPATTEYVTLNCISNNVGGDLMSTGAFTGAPLRDVVAMASPQAQASWVAFRARDGYTESLPLSTIQASPEILVAYELGVAPAGTRGVSKVEYTTDGGSTWITAPFDPPLSSLTWVLWRATWTPATEGAYKLMVRATDGSGALQDRNSAASYPSGASGYHSIQVNVSR